MKLRFLPIIALLLFSCEQNSVTIPKPRMYPKVTYPERNIIDFKEAYCPLNFKYPDYFEIEKDNYFFEDKPKHPCWFDLTSEEINSQLHFSYIEIKDREHLDELIIDAFKMAGKHNDKASYRREQIIENPEAELYGLMFEMDGPVAAPVQFFMTDSTQHFFRGSLYFNSEVNPDSIAPVLNFVKKDVTDMIESFNWK